MKFLLTFFCLALVSTFVSAQTSSDVAGVYRIEFDKPYKGPKMAPHYVIFRKDGSFIWGVDSSQSDIFKNTAFGNWSMSPQHEIKLTPSPKSLMKDTRYFEAVGEGRFMFTSVERNGVKERMKNVPANLILVRVKKLK